MKERMISAAVASNLVACPLIGLLIWYVPWEPDARSMVPVARYEQLERIINWSFLVNVRSGLYNSFNAGYSFSRIEPWNGLLPWQEEERQRLFNSLDPNERRGGRPAFVQLGILAKSPKSKNLGDFIRRGADLNSDDWGCTALVEAVGRIGIKPSAPRTFEERIGGKKPPGDDEKNVSLLVENGARIPPLSRLRPDCPASNPGLAAAIRRDGFIVGVTKVQGPTIAVKLIGPDSQPNDVALVMKSITDSGVELPDEVIFAAGRFSHPIAAKLVEKRLQSVRDEEAIALIVEHGLVPNVRLSEGETPLSVAIRKTVWLGQRVDEKGENRVHQLLALGADPNMRTVSGRLPIEVLLERCFSKSVTRIYEECRRESGGCSYRLDEINRALAYESELTPLFKSLKRHGADERATLQSSGRNVGEEAIDRCSLGVVEALTN